MIFLEKSAAASQTSSSAVPRIIYSATISRPASSNFPLTNQKDVPMREIHPTAIVDRRAELMDHVQVQAYCIIEGAVQIGRGTVIRPHSVLQGPARIGEDCRIGPAAYVGLPPQHRTADAGAGELIVGDRVEIRETATVHRSITAGTDHATRIGNDCYIMAGAHVGHDCVLGENVTLANAVLLGGHCRIGNRVFVGGGAALHQHVRVGRLAIVGGNEIVTQEVLPFAAIRGGGMRGFNSIGCRRSRMCPEAMLALRAFYRAVRRCRTIGAAILELDPLQLKCLEIREILDFAALAKRGILPAACARWAGRAKLAVSDGVDEEGNP
jgi:UDP-N-acetylglucosamine acyltransferase